ncbi:hypothetical protein L218DRAFT_900332 [Marasmius fiardii PR-910]|nr:hypothetical protein L218DRAFT_900332 [Marasmius fiardii PR-910]
MVRLQLLSSVSRTSSSLIASYLESLYQSSNSKYRVHIERVYREMLEPCLKSKTHFLRALRGGAHTVQVPFHDHEALGISDYFSGLGYFLTHLTPQTTAASLPELIRLLSRYAEWCRVSASVLNVNTPTVVQLLSNVPRNRFSLAASVSAGKGEGQEDVREERIKVLESVWSNGLIYPTPVQRAHAESGICPIEPTAELFGTPWGHCGETVTFASLYKSIHMGDRIGTLALAVKPMTCIIPGSRTVPVYSMETLEHLNDMVELLRVAGAMRPMCLNCVYLMDDAGGKAEDYAVTFCAPNDGRRNGILGRKIYQ